MVRAILDENSIIWIIIEGELKYEDFLNAVNPIFSSGKKYIGFISDGRNMSSIPASDQKKCSEHHKQNNSDKPNALLMKKSGMTMIAKIYIKFTGADNTGIFTDENEAINWVKNFKKE